MTTNRYKELVASKNGKFSAEWNLTDTRLADAVTLTLPPLHSLPIIFVPGIMGSNLCNLKGDPVWLLNGVKNAPLGLAINWSRKEAGERQQILHPERTKVFSSGAVPNENLGLGHGQLTYLQRGWGEVSEASYHEFLLWLDEKMNGRRNPADWADFSSSNLTKPKTVNEQLLKKLPPGIVMKMQGLPKFAEGNTLVEPIISDELLLRARAIFPIYACGYNWLGSNKDAAVRLKENVKKVIRENNVGLMKCSKVILITHSMGGLVARACCQFPEMSELIVGVVHGVMPATGAAVAYRRCKVGMADEDRVAGLVIGSDGKEVTAVFAQSPGALQLLPSMDYGSGWLEICDPTGKLISSLPQSDPYSEIYLERNKWWGLISEQWLKPGGGRPIDWDIYSQNIRMAREFHRGISGKYHRKTFVFYGGGAEKGSYTKIRWRIKRGPISDVGNTTPKLEDVLEMTYKQVNCDGSNNLYVTRDFNAVEKNIGAGSESDEYYWGIKCGAQDSAGDGTVPAISGQNPRKRGGENIIQQFELSGIKHEPAYRNPVARQVTYYAITKLAAIADLS
jgi:hypothetical protein